MTPGNNLRAGFVGLFAALRPFGRRWPLGAVAAGPGYIGVDALITPTTDLASPGLVVGCGTGLLIVTALLAWRARQPLPGDPSAL